ncbi:MAG: Ig-like domain-containing protein, partial [Ignisphaera sp.]
EARYWTVSIDAAFLYYARWTWRWRNTNTVVDPMTLCRGEYYNVSILMLDEADDTATDNYAGSAIGVTPYATLQILPPGQAVYQNLPAAGWTYWGGQTNSISFANELGTENRCQNWNGTYGEDQCWYHNRTLNITSNAQLGVYKLRLVSSRNNGAWQDDTNIITVRVIECRDVTLARDIKIYSPSGEDGLVMRGHIARIVVPLANYNTTQAISGNVSVEILDNNNNPVGWFFWDEKIKNFTIPPSPTPPNYNQSILTWRFEVPDDAPDITYTLLVNITQNTSRSYTFTKTFSLQKSEESNLYPLVIYTAPSYVFPCDSTTSGGYLFKLQVCNFGDYNLTNINITTEITPVPGNPPVNVEYGSGTYDATTNSIKWENININTSTCFISGWRIYGPEDVGMMGNLYTEVVFFNPITQQQEVVSKTDITGVCGGTAGTTGTVWGGSPTPFLNVTSVNPTSTFGLNYQLRTASATTGHIHYIELYIPPGFNATSFSRTPDLGFPVGSIDEGFTVKWTFFGVLKELVTPNTQNALLSLTNISLTSGGLEEFAPGGKVFTQNLLGYGVSGGGANVKAQWYGNYKVTLALTGPWLKVERYYKDLQTGWQSGFPKSFACGSFNTSLQVWNKGNLPANNFNITDNKNNVSVTHPNDLIFQNPWASDGSSSTIIQGSKVIWGNNNINFNLPTGKDFSRFYNYTISIPYQTNGTFRFQGIALNATPSYTFYDEPYTIFIACGASLSVSEPTTKIGEITNPTIYVGDTFNISSTIYNDGPGNASNVIIEINYTNTTPISGLENLVIKNFTQEISNLTYFETIGPKQSKVAHVDYTYIVNTSGVSPGTIRFCIKANATENSTEVIACKDVTLNAPPAVIEMENPLIISDETGTSTGSWGFNFTFNISIRVSNSDNDVAVCAYFSKTGTEPWKLVGCDSYPAPGSSTGQWRNFTFRFDADCEDIGSPVFAKFNATNNAGTTNSTSTTFTITKDKVGFEDIIGNDTETRRGKTTTLLALRVRDANGTLITNLPITFYVTLDGSIYDSGTTNTTNSSAYANYYFQARCSPKYQVGYQKWKAVLSNDACYQDNSTESYFNLSVLVTGDIILDFIRPDGLTNYTQEQEVPFLGATTDDCGDALTTTVRYFANKSSQSFECSP